MSIASLAGIKVFASGGIGGVHRGGQDNNVDLQQSAALAIAEITEKDVREVRRDTLEAIMYLLQSHDTEVQHDASAALGNLAVNTKNKLLIVKLGGLEPLICQMLSPNVKVQCNAVGCIANIAAHAGWAYKLGVLDYGGGVTMEICSGVTGLAYSLFICRRTGYGVKIHPHSVPHVVLGTSLLWFGWSGLNGSRSGTANVRAGLAMVETHLAACAGGLTWLIMTNWNVTSVLIGAIGAAVANTAVAFQSRLPWDDGLDIFAGHAMSGAVGVMLTGIIAQRSITHLDENCQQLVNA
ncbi:ammonium transporter AmtB-like domain-containing protein [Phakopsora pachyrhizi]|nr:ammonium transporter AmtB-like domain-containing protein [Phakopsora pachyrhizi]